VLGTDERAVSLSESLDLMTVGRIAAGVPASDARLR
jgi:hypothetical protein